MIELELPLRLESPNRTRGQHWGPLHKRASLQKLAVIGHVRWRMRAVDGFVWPGWTVTITRLGRELDDDNLVASAKHVRDGIAQALGHKSDRDPRVTWRYGQEPGQGVRIRIERRDDCA